MPDLETIKTLRATIEDFLRGSFTDVTRDIYRDHAVHQHGVATWVKLLLSPDLPSAAVVWSMTNMAPRVDGELTRFLATEGSKLDFGQFELLRFDQPPFDQPQIRIAHGLLAEYMSAEELRVAVEAVSFASSHYGPIIKERFGGSVYSDVSVRSFASRFGIERPDPPAPGPPAPTKNQAPTPDPATIQRTREKLERYFGEMAIPHSVDDAGDFMIRHDASISWVRPESLHGRAVVRVWSITNVGVRVDDDLTTFLVTTNAKELFGGFRLEERGPSVIFAHTLLGAHLNRPEFDLALRAVSFAAERFSPEIRARFGGTLFTES